MNEVIILSAGFAAVIAVQLAVGWRLGRRIVESFERAQSMRWKDADNNLRCLYDLDYRDARRRIEMQDKAADLAEELERRYGDKALPLGYSEICRILGL